MCYGDSAIEPLRHRVRECEDSDVTLLCCPEGTLGGLADYVDTPERIAIPRDGNALARGLEPLASESVTVIVGFTEREESGRYYNAAAVYSRGRVTGIYRKRHPAIRHSRYSAGEELPVFAVPGATLGVLICRDSVDATLMAALVAQGAHVVCIPTNNAMPVDRAGVDLVDEIRALDRQYAERFGITILRADVVGVHDCLTSAGTSMVTRSNGDQVTAHGGGAGELLVVDGV